jgi:hypothetical protein
MAYNRYGGGGRHQIDNPDSVPQRWSRRAAVRTVLSSLLQQKRTSGGIIPAKFFMTSAECGRCHKDIYNQWNSSAHHFASFNNQWYRKSIEYMQDVNGVKSSKWCAGCHDHAVFFQWQIRASDQGAD